MAALEFVVLLGCASLVSGALAHQLKVATPVLQLAASVLLLCEAELPPEVLLLVFLPVLPYWSHGSASGYATSYASSARRCSTTSRSP
ncbi:hypothetical protein [Streptomyces sp. NPDC050535]|uniref:hypothetical protein n=1 Tax=Streptomyces sp. NPDC050535 TaxID=3365626 RepID=UPI0037B72712